MLLLLTAAPPCQRRFGPSVTATVSVRYLYDEDNGRRLKTVELIVESVPWRPRPRHLRRGDDEIVAVRIAWAETELPERARRLGAVWRPAQKVWESPGGRKTPRFHRPSR